MIRWVVVEMLSRFFSCSLMRQSCLYSVFISTEEGQLHQKYWITRLYSDPTETLSKVQRAYLYFSRNEQCMRTDAVFLNRGTKMQSKQSRHFI